MAVLPTSLPTRDTRRYKVSLMMMTPAATNSVKGAGRWCGVTISRIAMIEMPIAAPSSINETTAAASGSALPCP